MASTEGSQRYINKSVLHSIDTRQSPLDDLFRLRINSNDPYSRWFHPNNNCYDFTIEFPQGSAESIQYRISQCNRYQLGEIKECNWTIAAGKEDKGPAPVNHMTDENADFSIIEKDKAFYFAQG